MILVDRHFERNADNVWLMKYFTCRLTNRLIILFHTSMMLLLQVIFLPNRPRTKKINSKIGRPTYALNL